MERLVGPLYLKRTTRGLTFIENLSRYKKFWRIFGEIGIIITLGAVGASFLLYHRLSMKKWNKILITLIVGLTIVGLAHLKFNLATAIGGAMGLIFFLLVETVRMVLTSTEPVDAVQVLIPGITIPFWYGIFGIMVLIVVHELSHAIVARTDGIRIKSSGIIFFSLLPIGAFIEPDEDDLMNSNKISRMRVFSVGSLSNFIAAAIATTVFLSLFPVLMISTGIEVADVVKGSPAYGVLEKDMVIMEINDIKVNDLDSFTEFMNNIKPGDVLKIRTNKGTVTIKTTEHPQIEGRGYIGFYPRTAYEVTPHIREIFGDFPKIVIYIFYWVGILNMVVGLMNLLPIKILDGGRLYEEIVNELFPNHATIIMHATTMVVLFLFGILITPKLISG